MFRLSRMIAVVLSAVVAAPGPVAVAAPLSPLYPYVITPKAGAGVPVDVPLMVAGYAVYGEAGGLDRLELSFDGGDTWVDADHDAENYDYSYTPTEVGRLDIWARITYMGVLRDPVVMTSINVGAPGTPRSPALWQQFQTPVRASTPYPPTSDGDTQAVEVGVRLRFDQDGFVPGVFLPFSSPGTCSTLNFWSADGTPIASTSLTRMSRTTMFSRPIPVTADTEYVISYYCPHGGYITTENYFTGVIASSPFYLPYDEDTGAGVYHYGEGGGFPTDSWQHSNYWIEPMFTPPATS